MFETDALRLLVAVTDTGSFTGAALKLNYTQSAVSRRIASLERQAGGPLFERLPRGVRLTPAGRVLHLRAVEVLDGLTRASHELAALHAGRGGLLRVGAFATANISLMPGALSAFGRTRPGVGITVVEGRSGTLVDRLVDGSLDLAVVSDYPSGLPATEGVTTYPLREDELLVALRHEHPLAGAGTVELRDLRDEVWVQDAPADSPALLADAWARAGFRPRRVIRVAEWAGKFGYAAAGLGIALVPALAARAVPAGLVLCRLGGLPPHRTVHVALPDAPLPAAVELRDLLRAAAG
ncbi:LysR family transcriptional regulator [uncultured Streptomyces sp.]|uniref:LysR family transcriptional regulator n=1 Tax=uncultured Streptomyces sp. TaxID=174707 RepID=UPI002622A2C6|nr:LysR family transcriptional regulator [uncultured Streptomyces sp.]